MGMRCTRETMKSIRWTLVLALAAAAALASPVVVRPERMDDAAEIRLALDRLGVTARALYVAAHPDDENTAMLAWLANGRLVRTAYLATTRGDGGQNLIGTEKGELLGVIRTQELLEARAIDGGEQFFTRAIDFGYSKGPEETLRIWGKEKILEDFVRVYREFKPDVIVTRFPVDGDGGHGHHTASAILAEEAFRLAGDGSYRGSQPLPSAWQPKRIFWNSWRPEQTAGLLSVDLGSFSPLLGRSFTELAGESRSLHKSQGFGAAERRGTMLNWLEQRGGDPARTDPFEGIEMGWRRVAGGDKFIPLIQKAKDAFRADEPWRIVPPLVELRHAMQAVSGKTDWERDTIERKITEVDELIRQSAGIWIEAISPAPSAIPGSTVEARVTVINRSPLDVAAQLVKGSSLTGERRLDYNQPWTEPVSIVIPADAALSHPHWLREPATPGAYTVSDRRLIGLAASPEPLRVPLVVTVYGEPIAFEVPVHYRWTDPVLGERYRPLEIHPPVTANLESGIIVFPDRRAKRVRAVVSSAIENAIGTIRPVIPEGWNVEPGSADFSIRSKGGEQIVGFLLTPPAGESRGDLTLMIEPDGWNTPYSLGRFTIDYSHITPQTLLPHATATLIRADIERDGRRIGYVMGAGDEIPDSLRQIGYDVTLLTDEQIELGSLEDFDAIVIGVRAYNTKKRLASLQERLFEYARNGGTLVTQYNTLEREMPDLAPYPLRISRERVSVEEAPVRILDPTDPLMSSPNRITTRDFEGWVQERGLYFPDSWGPEFKPLLEMDEPDEAPKRGALLVAKIGRGIFVYAPISFFRQLPAGVPGAYRLFANLVAARNGGTDGPD